MFDYICLGVCILHIICFVYEFIHNLIQGKKISKLCDKCNTPVFEGEEHECFELFKSLPKEKVELVCNFIDFLKGDKNG